MPGSQEIVHQDHLLAGHRLQKLAEAHGHVAAVLFGPIYLAGAQRFAQAVGHRQARRGGRNDGKLGDDRAQLGVGAQFAAQADAERFGVAVIAHGQRRFQVDVGMQAVEALEVPLLQGAGLAQEREHLILGGNQFHGLPAFR